MKALVPYSKQVRRTPPGYWDRGTRVLVFAGPKAWDMAREWLAVETWEMPQARHRYTLVCPPDLLANADVLRWPVEGKKVVIVQCGGSPAALSVLIGALQRDGCAEGEVFDLIGAPEHPLGWAWSLRALQPWSRADFDSEVMREHAERDRAELHALEDAVVDAWCERLAGDVAGLAYAAQCPPGTVGEAVSRRLALRAMPEAA